MWTLKALQNNYEDGVVVGYGVGKGSLFTAASSFNGGNMVVMVPYLGPLSLVDMTTTTIGPFAQCSAVLATFDKQAWLYQYGGQGGLTCTINADGSVSFVGDNGVIVPLPAESVDEAVGALSPYIASASNYYDRTTVVGPNGPEQYVIFGGAKFWIPSPDVATSLKLDLSQTQAISQSALSSIPVIPLDGTLLRELSSAPVYLIRQSQKAHILSSASVDTNGGWSNVRVVPDGALNIIPAGADIA